MGLKPDYKVLAQEGSAHAVDDCLENAVEFLVDVEQEFTGIEGPGHWQHLQSTQWLKAAIASLQKRVVELENDHDERKRGGGA